MSDFGTMLTVERTDGTDVSPDDERLINRLAKDLVIGPGDRVSDYADYDLRFGGSSSADGVEGVLVILTGYMIGDEAGNDGWSDDALIARDRPLAEQFGAELQRLLGSGFNVEVYCGHW